MTASAYQPIDDPSAWTADDVRKGDGFAFDLEPRHVAALERAFARVRRDGLGPDDIAPATFPLAEIADDIAKLRQQLQWGPGFATVRGWPVERLAEADLALMYYGFASHLGRPLVQSVLGDRLGRVEDRSDQDPNERAYRNRMALPLHTDNAGEIVGMLCVRPATEGGASRYVSATAIHNRIARERPDLLASLYEGFHYHRRGEETPGEAAITPHKVPVFSTCEGYLSCRYIGSRLRAAAKALAQPWPAAFADAVALFEAATHAPDLCLDFTIAPGTAVFHNNYTVLHGRNAFHDRPVSAAKRLLLRMWLKPEPGRPVVPATEIFSGGAISPQAGRRPTFASEAFVGTIYAPKKG